MATTDEKVAKQFVQLYASCETRLFAYVMAITGNRSDTEEVLQEAVLVLWRRFGDFVPGTNFYAWAKQVAFYTVMNVRKKQIRLGMPMDSAFLGSIESAFAEKSDSFDLRLAALEDCLKKMTNSDRQLIAARYGSSRNVKELSQELGRPVNTLYKNLERIRHTLIECIERTLARDSRA